MAGEKIYIVKTKEGAHINKKMKADGSRAALQFDNDNSLLGPVDLVEVDKSEFIREVYKEPEHYNRSIGQKIVEEAIIPAGRDALNAFIYRSLALGADALGKWVVEKGIPAIRAKSIELFDTVCDVFATEEPVRIEKKKTASAVKQSSEIVIDSVKPESRTVVHSQEEVDQIINNMKYAALYIAAGIRELSNTVIEDDRTDPQKVLDMQQKLRELSSEDVMNTIGFMLEDKNRDVLDQATIRLFEAFRQKELIVEGEAVPISRYLTLAS